MGWVVETGQAAARGEGNPGQGSSVHMPWDASAVLSGDACHPQEGSSREQSVQPVYLTHRCPEAQNWELASLFDTWYYKSC